MDEEIDDLFVSKLILKIEELSEENKKLKQEIEILVEALRDCELKLKFGAHI